MSKTIVFMLQGNPMRFENVDDDISYVALNSDLTVTGFNEKPEFIDNCWQYPESNEKQVYELLGTIPNTRRNRRIKFSETLCSV